VIRKSIRNYYSFGSNARYLRDVQALYRVGAISDQFVAGAIHNFTRHLANLDLQVTIRAAGKLKKVFSEIMRLKQSDRLSRTLASDLREAMSNLMPTLVAEIAGLLMSA
jgi:hypothetical protein